MMIDGDGVYDNDERELLFFTHVNYFLNPYFADGKCDWIATEWLKKWLHEDETSGSNVGPINNYKFECKHKNLDPHKVKELKRISSKTVSNSTICIYL